MVQWLGLRIFTAERVGSIPGWGTKIPQTMWRSQILKNKEKKAKSFLRLVTEKEVRNSKSNHCTFEVGRGHLAKNVGDL